MPTLTVMPKGINPRLTEQYLLSMTEVIDASVMWSEGVLHAYVTVPDDLPVSRHALQSRCMEELGLHQTPRVITFMRARTRQYFRAA